MVRSQGEALLVDSGYGSDVRRTLELLGRHGLEPGGLRVFNTHWHSDHVGGNHVLQEQFGATIAAHEAEGRLVNERFADACGADWLDQPVERYRVDQVLAGGAVLDVGSLRLHVVPTPGHSLGHASLFEPRSRVLLGGDALLPGDVAWINPFLDGAGAGELAFGSVAGLRELRPELVVPGHGRLISDVPAAIEDALERYRRLFAEPARLAAHGARRVFGYALMIHGGIPRDELDAYLHARRWVHDLSGLAGTAPEAFARGLVEGMVRSGSAAWSAERLVSTVPHSEPPEGWLRSAGFPARWE